MNKGYHTITWDGRNEDSVIVSSGLYICELKYGEQKLVTKLLFAK